MRLRAGLWHPLVFVAPWVAACLLIAARPGSDVNEISWGFWLMFLGPLGSLVTTFVMVFNRPLRPAERFWILLLGLIASGAAFFLGALGWFQAADVACHGRYECPF